MEITKLFSFLVYPGKNEKNPEDVVSTEIPLSGKLFGMLNHLFDVSSRECNIPIRFVVAEDGPQKFNDVRDQVIGFIENPTIDLGKGIAIRLRDVTTKVPGIALLFLIVGKHNMANKFLISRFPAEQGVLADTKEGGLEIEFIERIFMKNSLAYKAVLYEYSDNQEANFWSGTATDKQRNFGNEIANYWIKDFLHSDYKTTSEAGTIRLVTALRAAINDADSLPVKQELLGMSILAKSFDKKAYSIPEILDKFNISIEGRNLLVSKLPKNSQILDETFQIDSDVFVSKAPFRSVELNTGAIMLGPTEKFDEIIEKELINSHDNLYRISAEGRIINENLKARK